MIYGSRNNHVFGGIHYGWQPPRVASSFSPDGPAYAVSAQTAINYEIGTRLAPTRWLRSELTGFLISYENEVVTSSSAGNNEGLTNGGPRVTSALKRQRASRWGMPCTGRRRSISWVATASRARRSSGERTPGTSSPTRRSTR